MAKRISKHVTDFYRMPRLVRPFRGGFEPCLIPGHHARTFVRLRLHEYTNNSRELAEFTGFGDVPPQAVIAGYQASGLLNERSGGEMTDAVFLRHQRVEPLPLQVESLSGEERAELLENHQIAKRIAERTWSIVNEHECVWDDVQLWGREVFSIRSFFGNHPPLQLTHSGMVEQWRMLATLAVQYLKSWQLLTRSKESSPDAGFVERCPGGDDLLVVAQSDRALVCAAIPRIMMGKFGSGSGASGMFWKDGILELDERGNTKFDSMGVPIFKARWERTHWASFAGTAVLAWAFAQVRLRRIFDALDVSERTTMQATARCLAHLAPILIWEDEDLDLVERVELEVIAAAASPRLQGASKHQRADPPPMSVEAQPLPRFDGWTKKELCRQMDCKGTTFDTIRKAAFLPAQPRGGEGAAFRYSPTQVRKLIAACRAVDAREHPVRANKWREYAELLAVYVPSPIPVARK
jgi:hypothetical protein